MGLVHTVEQSWKLCSVHMTPTNTSVWHRVLLVADDEAAREAIADRERVFAVA